MRESDAPERAALETSPVVGAGDLTEGGLAVLDVLEDEVEARSLDAATV